jgi:hypothetical protein
MAGKYRHGMPGQAARALSWSLPGAAALAAGLPAQVQAAAGSAGQRGHLPSAGGEQLPDGQPGEGTGCCPPGPAANPGIPCRPGPDVSRVSEQRLAVGRGTAPTSARRAGGRTGSERGLDGGRDEPRGLGVDDDVPAQQNTADDLPGVRRRVARADGGRGGTGGIRLGHTRDCRRNSPGPAAGHAGIATPFATIARRRPTGPRAPLVIMSPTSVSQHPRVGPDGGWAAQPVRPGELASTLALSRRHQRTAPRPNQDHIPV